MGRTCSCVKQKHVLPCSYETRCGSGMCLCGSHTMLLGHLVQKNVFILIEKLSLHYYSPSIKQRPIDCVLHNVDTRFIDPSGTGVQRAAASS